MEICPLRVIREKLGLSQKELSISSGRGLQNVSGVETGTRQTIPAKILLALKTHANADTEKLEKDFRAWYLKLTDDRKSAIIKRLERVRAGRGSLAGGNNAVRTIRFQGRAGL